MSSLIICFWCRISYSIGLLFRRLFVSFGSTTKQNQGHQPIHYISVHPLFLKYPKRNRFAPPRVYSGHLTFRSATDFQFLTCSWFVTILRFARRNVKDAGSGDFEEIYGATNEGSENHSGSWDAILTCFFIDTVCSSSSLSFCPFDSSHL
jgi:hypothetical protein